MTKLILAILLVNMAACEPSNSNNPATIEDPAGGMKDKRVELSNAHERGLYSRAFNAVIWGMPAVNPELMHESLLQAKGDYNQVVYWPGLINANNQTLTPNPDVIYINPFYDTRQGPVVLDIPAGEGVSSLTGSIDDGWQTVTEDVGPAGVDKGKGGKCLILADERTKAILATAIRDAHEWLDERYQQLFKQPFYEGASWTLPADPIMAKEIATNYADPNNYPTDERGVVYAMGYFSAKHLGTGQYYLMSIKDNKGQALDGSKLYQLHLPPNVPVKLYWSVTVYDRETHALQPGRQYFSRASTTPGLQKNADGSVDLYFGAKAGGQGIELGAHRSQKGH